MWIPSIIATHPSSRSCMVIGTSEVSVVIASAGSCFIRNYISYIISVPDNNVIYHYLSFQCWANVPNYHWNTTRTLCFQTYGIYGDKVTVASIFVTTTTRRTAHDLEWCCELPYAIQRQIGYKQGWPQWKRLGLTLIEVSQQAYLL